MASREALVVCGEKMSGGVTVWDLESGEELLRIPSSGSPPHGLLCLRDQRLLVASQFQKDRPFGGGAIFVWPLLKPQPPQRSYTMEAIVPIAGTRDGVYLAGGAPSGNAYIWEVPSGRLLKNWHAHHKPLSHLAFSRDDSFLISGSEDGIVCIWCVISVLNIADPQACGGLPPFHTWSDHVSSITGLVPLSSGPNSALITSSLDGTCKVWDLISGSLLQTHVFSFAVTAIAVDPEEQLLFVGREDGKIYCNALDLGLQEIQIVVSENESGVLCGHKGPVTALAFSLRRSWLISASKDCTALLWDLSCWQVIRRFDHGKGHITNLAVIPQSFLSVVANGRNCVRPRISLLDKATHPNIAHEGTLTLLPVYCSQEEQLPVTNFRSSDLLSMQILDSEQGRTSAAVQMRIDTTIENRLWIIAMTKHMNTINQQLQSRILGMMEDRLRSDGRVASSSRRRAKTDDAEEKTQDHA